jgi:hypothetical protein
MSDMYDRVKGDQDFIQKILGKVPGFSGYIERANRRASDKLLRTVVADRYNEQWQRVSGLQRDLISQGEIKHVGELESAAIKLRQFIDRVRTASYGYSGFFDAVKVNQDELAQVYQYDLALLDNIEQIKHAIDNVEASIGSDGLPAAIRFLTSVCQQAVEAFNRRSDVMIGGVGTTSQTQ